MASEIKVNTIKDLGGNTIVSSNGSGTISGLPASAISSGTVATARLGSGTASSSTFLAGDSSYKTVSGTTINNNADNRVITGSGTANTLEGEANFTFDGTSIYSQANLKLEHTGDAMRIIRLDADRGAGGNSLGDIEFQWNGNVNAKISGIAGNDTTNKDDANLDFYVRESGSAIARAMTINKDGVVGIGANNNADLGSGLHIRTADSGASVDANSDELVLENSGHSGMTILSGTGNSGYIVWGDSGNNAIGRIFYNHASNYMRFDTNASEAMRINDAGRFGFGTSSIAHPFHFLYNVGGDAVMAVENSNNSNPQGIDLQFTAANPNNTSQYAIHFGTTAGSKFIVYSNGNVVNANNSYGSTSDNRLKENITDANSQWNDVKKLKFKNFNLINDSTSQLGVIAQDLENDGMSGLVDESLATKQAIAINPVFGTLYEDGDILPEGKNIGDVKTNLEDVKSVKYSVLLLKSAKALQEAMEKIETLETANTNKDTAIADLTTRLEALENA